MSFNHKTGRHAATRPRHVRNFRHAILMATIAAATASALAIPALSAGAATAPSWTTTTDEFGRSISNGWAGSPSAQWTVSPATISGTTSPTFSVDGQRGVIAGQRSAEARALLGGSPVVDADIRIDTSFDSMPSGSGVYSTVFARQNGTAEYRGTLRIDAMGKVSVLIYRESGGETIIGPETILAGMTYAVGAPMSARFQVTGTHPTQLKMTVWPRGSNEPMAQVTAQDDDSALQKVGAQGLLLRLSSRATSSTITGRYDNFSSRRLNADEPTAPAPTTAPTTTPPSSTSSPTSAPTTALSSTTPSTTGPTPAGCIGRSVTPGSDIVGIVNSSPAGSTVCVAAGRYRLAAPLVPASGVKILGQPGAVLDGSRTLTGWTASGGGWFVDKALPGAYSSPGQCEDNVMNPCLKAEQLFLDGSRLKRVMSRDALTLGTFFQDYAANRVWIGADPAGHRVDMDSTRWAIRSFNTNVTVSGLRIEHFASLGQQGALFAGANGWTIKGNTVADNHAVGIYLSNSSNSIVSGNTISGNGQLGLSQYTSQQVTITNNVITNNNTEGFWIADWEAGGYKATWSSVVFSGNTVSGNAGIGVWFDCDANGAVVENNQIINNKADGIRYEISYNGTIRNNNIVGNGFGMGRGGGTSIYASAGINSHSSSNMEIYGNTVTNNINGIGLQMRNRGSGKYGLWELTNNHVYNNTITMTEGTIWGQGATGIGQLGGTAYLTGHGNWFRGNNYVIDSRTARRFSWNNTYLNIDQWKAAGNDTSGTALTISSATSK